MGSQTETGSWLEVEQETDHNGAAYGNQVHEAEMAAGTSPSIHIAVVSHKPYRVPDDPLYLPLHVGAALNPDVLPDWVQDDTGDNISVKNAKYSELTGLYWLWKNDGVDYQGIVHYRRHFETRDLRARIMSRDRFDKIVKSEELSELLRQMDIVLPRKRNYYIETIYSHYAHTLPVEHLDKTGEIVRRLTPEYFDSFKQVMNSTSAHMFNMFVMSREKLGQYCSWLFPILEELERQTDDETYDSFNSRYPGRVSEMLLDVWLKTNGYEFAELPVISPEPVNWLKKGSGFLMAKFGGKKYEQSF